jgi:hypothetical protein
VIASHPRAPSDDANARAALAGFGADTYHDRDADNGRLANELASALPHCASDRARYLPLAPAYLET